MVIKHLQRHFMAFHGPIIFSTRSCKICDPKKSRWSERVKNLNGIISWVREFFHLPRDRNLHFWDYAVLCILQPKSICAGWRQWVCHPQYPSTCCRNMWLKSPCLEQHEADNGWIAWIIYDKAVVSTKIFARINLTPFNPLSVHPLVRPAKWPLSPKGSSPPQELGRSPP